MCVWGGGIWSYVDKRKQCGLKTQKAHSPQIHQQAACPLVAGITPNIG